MSGPPTIQVVDARGAPRSTASIRDRASFDFIRYGNVWEDADVLCDALAAVAPGGRVLSIASSGDNALALLTLDPAEVIAADLSPAQIACAELRIAAFRKLDDAALLGFLGVTPRDDRAAVYRALQSDLAPASRQFWDERPAIIAAGIVHAGRFERYLRGFRRYVLPLVHSRRTLEDLCRPRSIPEQHVFYAERWDTWRWRALFKIFFSRQVMGRLGRDPAFFDHVDGPVGERILARSRYALTELPTSVNPYLTYIMTGNYRPGALPRYLRPEHLGTIRSRLDRLRTEMAPIERAGAGRFDAFNLSDIFEYMSEPEHTRCYSALIDRAQPGARLVYWNMLAPRGRPESERHRARELPEIAEALHCRDLAWFYQRLHVDEVLRAEAA